MDLRPAYSMYLQTMEFDISELKLENAVKWQVYEYVTTNLTTLQHFILPNTF